MQNSRRFPEIGISLRQFEYFLAAVEHGSISAAAEAQYVSQPSLSDQIRRMEKTLGIGLFIRTNKSLVLTEAGRELVPHAEKALDAAYDAIDAIVPIRDLTGGSITYGTFSAAWLLFHKELIERFRVENPKVRMKLVSDSSVKIADEVREGRIEAAIVGLPIDDRGLDTQPLEWSPQLYYFSNDPSKAVQPKSIFDIVEADLVMAEVMWVENAPTHRRLMEIAQKEGLTVQPVIEVSTMVALQLAASGVADTIAPYSLVDAANMNSQLYGAPLLPEVRENFAFIKRKNSNLSPGAKEIQRIIESCLTNIPTVAPPPD